MYARLKKHTGQLETREYYQCDDIKRLREKKDWHGLKTIGMVKTTIVKGEKTTVEKRFYISSLPVGVILFACSIRDHWSIESMHWHLDVTFKEDANTTDNKIAARNQNIIRKRALAILKQCENIFRKHYSMKAKRFILSMTPMQYFPNALLV
ncbi:ISAs1 family transposase [Treponema pedis]|uniref:ISAs1 family transposase n=1 Tax=Treponema pedis TaxID=409322 RepID=UPI003D205106